MRRGPVEVLVMAFPVGAEPEVVAAAVRGPIQAGTIRMIDVVLVLRGEDGAFDMRDLEDGIPDALASLVSDPHTLLSDEDLELVVRGLAADKQAAVLVVEHLWAKEAAERIDRAGGELALFTRVSAFDVDMAFASAEM